MQCIQCGTEQETGLYCGDCGAALESARPAVRYCVNCGEALNDAPHTCTRTVVVPTVRERSHSSLPDDRSASRVASASILGARPVWYVSVARRLGCNWGMWLPLAMSVLTLLTPWWRFSVEDLRDFSLPLRPMENGVPLATYAFVVALVVAALSIYVALGDERIGLARLGIGDAWVALVGCALILPLLPGGFSEMFDRRLPGTFSPTGIAGLTLALTLAAAVDAGMAVRQGNPALPLGRRGSWRWESAKPNDTTQVGRDLAAQQQVEKLARLKLARLGRWATAIPIEESGRTAYLNIARKLGANWGMWLGLVAALITFWLPWWHVADSNGRGIQPQDLHAPAYWLAGLPILGASAAVIYLVLSDSRINAFCFSLGDAWVTLGAVVLLTPCALTGLMHYESLGDSVEPTYVALLTLTLLAFTALEAIRLIRRAPATLGLRARGKWVWTGAVT